MKRNDGTTGAVGKRPKGRGGMAGRHRSRLVPGAADAEKTENGGKVSRTSRGKTAPPAPKPPTARGFLHAAAFAAPRIREVSSSRGFAESRILTEWDVIIGTALARSCRPIKVSYSARSFGATLVIEADGSRAPEVEMQGPRIVERVNAHYGYRAVSRVKVVQTARGSAGFAVSQGFAEDSRGFDRGATSRGADAGASDALDDVSRNMMVADVRDPGLRAALERLSRGVAARQARNATSSKGRRK